MDLLDRRTKIVATIGPASSSPDVIRQMIKAGMNIARLNFSHGNYKDHAARVHLLRAIADELETPITILQDLQGPKVRVGQLPEGGVMLVTGESITLVPDAPTEGPRPNSASRVSIDYPHLAKEAKPGTQILLDDGLLELVVTAVEADQVHCKIVQGGILKSRKGVNLPGLELSLPSLTPKDRQDVEFGVSQAVDYMSLSFVRRASDIQDLRHLLAEHGSGDTPVVAKIEKPQAIANLEEILDQVDAIMVARGDLGVEMRPEKVPLLQKQIIRACNQRGTPVITATQMLESMIHEPRPTRAEASDVANAVIDGTDAVMLSGESAVGDFPVESVAMLARIIQSVEPEIQFVNNPPATQDETHAVSEALNVIDKTLPLRCIVALTSSGYTARLASGERPKAPVIALTPSRTTYHRLNLCWGIRPILLEQEVDTFEAIALQAQAILTVQDWASPGDRILIVGGIPPQHAGGTNFLKIHTITAD
ncbi:MAG: pyruvate kinase [Cyanobacteria bacterium P01_A01_bin.135]